MGLPSPGAEDLNHWIEFIRIVIAFQCRKYGEPSIETQSRNDVEKLESLLRQLERQRKIDSYVVYDGYLEEVVLRGYDNSPHRIEFYNSEFITLFNLDFCNKITSPLEFVSRNGALETAYKFNAIQKILEIQKGLSNLSNKFLFLLTVHCSYDGEELQNFIHNPPTSMIKAKLSDYHRLSGVDKNARIVRLFVIHLIQQHFLTFGFTPKVLPVIQYQGLGQTTLLHFVFLGISSQSSGGSYPLFQEFDEIIGQKFIQIDSKNFTPQQPVLSDEQDVDVDPVDFFTQSKTYQKLWK